MVRSCRENGRELDQGGVEVPTVDQCAAERGSRRSVFGVQGESGAADLDGLVQPTGTPELFGKGRKCERRRILVDPASQLLNARAVRHEDSLAEP